MSKTLTIICAAAVILMIPVLSCCEEGDREMRTIDGNIVSADWQESAITVKWLHTPGEIEFKEETFYVPGNAKIQRHGGNIWLMDIDVGAHVMVDYYDDDGKLTVKNIIVKN